MLVNYQIRLAKALLNQFSPLKKLQCACCLLWILQVKNIEGGKKRCKTRLERRLSLLTNKFDAHHLQMKGKAVSRKN